LFEFPADRNAKGLLVVAQQSWHKSRRNASHVQIVRQNALNGTVWQSYYSTNIVDSLPTICKDKIAKFCYFFRFCACRRSPRTFIVVDTISSVLEAFVPQKKVSFCLVVLSPKASYSIRWVAATVFLRLKQNLMQILCSWKSVISVVKNRRMTKT